MNIFDILGPVMVGPSSSHTAGAARIGLMTRKLLGAEPVEADIRMYGSFAATGKGHGTDRAIIAGLLGMEPDDMRIPESFAIAEKEGMKFTFGTADLKGAHPNSVVLHVKGKNGRERKVQACSLGGGRIMINELDGIELNCTCEMPTIVVNHVDQPGRVAEVTTMLSMLSINIATMSVYRDRRGGRAVMVVELDQEIDEKRAQYPSELEGHPEGDIYQYRGKMIMAFTSLQEILDTCEKDRIPFCEAVLAGRSSTREVVTREDSSKQMAALWQAMWDAAGSYEGKRAFTGAVSWEVRAALWKNIWRSMNP